MMEKLALVAIALFLFTFPVTASAALNPPAFPTCANPSGVLKIQYNSGTHGIAGNTNSYSGSDTVYNLSGDNALQCFCAEDGAGIQTNWWKVTSITDDERRILEAQGWHYVPDGAAWGLANTVYMAKNNNYSCKGSNSGSSSGSSSSNDSGVAGASAAGSSSGMGQVLGLATTGSMNSIVSVISLGLGLISLGLFLRAMKRT